MASSQVIFDNCINQYTSPKDAKLRCAMDSQIRYKSSAPDLTNQLV